MKPQDGARVPHRARHWHGWGRLGEERFCVFRLSHHRHRYSFAVPATVHVLCAVTAASQLSSCWPCCSACNLHAQLGNHFFAKADKVDLYKYDITADKDDSVPAPEPTEGQTVSGKPREFLKYAPMWTAHPDHDRVRSHPWPDSYPGAQARLASTFSLPGQGGDSGRWRSRPCLASRASCQNERQPSAATLSNALAPVLGVFSACARDMTRVSGSGYAASPSPGPRT